MHRLPVVRHRTARQAWAKHRACRHPVEKARWHAVWLLARTDSPRTPAQVADVVGLSAVTVRDVLHRWNAGGPDGLTDRRAGNGSAPRLTARRRSALDAALRRRPPNGGLWTGPKVARYVRDRWAIEERHVRPPRATPAGNPSPLPETGRRPYNRQGGHRVPMGRQPGSVIIQRKTV